MRTSVLDSLSQPAARSKPTHEAYPKSAAYQSAVQPPCAAAERTGRARGQAGSGQQFFSKARAVEGVAHLVLGILVAARSKELSHALGMIIFCRQEKCRIAVLRKDGEKQVELGSHYACRAPRNRLGKCIVLHRRVASQPCVAEGAQRPPRDATYSLPSAPDLLCR